MFDVLLITGGAGSGKTSTAEAWANSRSGVAAHLSHDTVHTYVKSGVISPADGANVEADRQWRIAIDICVAACQIYVSEGIRCAIDTFLLPGNLRLWSGIRDLRVGLVVLRLDVEISVRRNGDRQIETGWGVPEWQVRANHEAMSAWENRCDVLLADNSNMELTEVLALVDEWESGGSLSGLSWPDASPT